MTRPTLLRFRELLQDNGIASAWSPLFDQQTARVYEVLFPEQKRIPSLFHADADELVRRAQEDDAPEPHMVRFHPPCACQGQCYGVTSDNLGPGGTRCRANSRRG